MSYDIEEGDSPVPASGGDIDPNQPDRYEEEDGDAAGLVQN